MKTPRSYQGYESRQLPHEMLADFIAGTCVATAKWLLIIFCVWGCGEITDNTKPTWWAKKGDSVDVLSKGFTKVFPGR